MKSVLKKDALLCFDDKSRFWHVNQSFGEMQELLLLANKVYQTISQIMNQEQGKGLSNNKGSAREPGKKNHANEIEGLFFPYTKW